MTERTDDQRPADTPANPLRSGQDVSPPRRRRQRLPVCVRLHLDDTLPANGCHPLGRSAPEARGASRVRMIAAVLARLARAAGVRQP